jgi:sulfoxide reductase catalytic subunit YedY
MAGIKIDRSEVTPESLYRSRREFIRGFGAAAAGALLAASCIPGTPTSTVRTTPSPAIPDQSTTPAKDDLEGTPPPTALSSPVAPLPTLSADKDELGDKLTPENTVDTFSNYYEFSVSPQDVARAAEGFVTSPWTIQVGGLAKKPRAFGTADLLGFAQQERIYRMRCVEAWSMVIPWIGFPLARLLEQVEPASEARYVRFETLYAPEQMAGQQAGLFRWPYVEGLRLDEAMHDLTILATGLYGKLLLPQAGAPVRLVVPWKYGFKSIKAIVRIDLVEEMPTTFWMAQSPQEYGFYANVNPDVPHPRWPQSTERRLGELGRRKTWLFNGYGEQVAQLYEGMDLVKWF